MANRWPPRSTSASARAPHPSPSEPPPCRNGSSIGLLSAGFASQHKKRLQRETFRVSLDHLLMKALLDRLHELHDTVFHYVGYIKSPFLFFVRLYWGWQLVQSGWGKLHNLPGVTEFFTSLHLPAPGATAVFISCLEFFGGILLAVGLFSRIISLMMAVNLIVAYITADNE